MPLFPQVRHIILSDEVTGMAFDSQLNLAVSAALEGCRIDSEPITGGQRVFSSLNIVNSHQPHMEELGMSFEAQSRYGFF